MTQRASQVIKNAKGLAIFTTMRTGLWVSGAGGSGILVGRTADGSWSPPSGIMLHTAGLGFLVGVDIYDCVVVINTQQALDAFSKIRCTLGGEVSAVAGPVGAGGLLETEIHKRQAPVFTYLKSRGFYAGIQIDGTVVIERTDENERYYGQRISVGDILAGKVRHPPYETRKLLETIKAAQGDKDVDETMLPSEPPPGDFEIEESTHMFGVPDKEDPDPYGVLALEKEGMSIREAGTHKRASWEQFAFQPAPTSPIYSTYSRASIDRDGKAPRPSTRSSWQTHARQTSNDNIAVGSNSIEAKRQPLSRTMTDMSTQTDPSDEPVATFSSTRSSVVSGRPNSMNGILEDSTSPISAKPKTLRTRSSRSSGSGLSARHRVLRSDSPPQQQASPKPKEEDESPSSEQEEKNDVEDSFDADGEDTAEETDVVIEEPVVHSVQKAAAPQFISRARLVEVPKRVAPKLPPRNPRRSPLIINAEPGAERLSETGSEPASPPSQSPTWSSKTATSPPSSRPDLERSYSSKDELSERFEDVDMSPEEKKNPWGAIIARHNGSQESVDIPGAFHSLPPSPDDTKEGAKAL